MASKVGQLETGSLGHRGAGKGAPPTDFTGLAAKVAGQPWTWTGSDLTKDSKARSFVLQLTPEDIGNIEQSLQSFKS